MHGLAPGWASCSGCRPRRATYEYAPLVQVQAWSEVPRGTSLFESHFIFENYPAERAAAAPAACG